MSRILVTGGAGYIGAIATNLLLDAGYEVVVLDDLSTGHKESVDSRAKFVQGSILDKEVIIKALAGCEGVLHFAGKSLVGESVLKPDLYMETNIEGSRNLITVMHELGVKKIVFSSSASTYGEPSSIPISENSETRLAGGNLPPEVLRLVCGLHAKFLAEQFAAGFELFERQPTFALGSIGRNELAVRGFPQGFKRNKPLRHINPGGAGFQEHQLFQQPHLRCCQGGPLRGQPVFECLLVERNIRQKLSGAQGSDRAQRCKFSAASRA